MQEEFKGVVFEFIKRISGLPKIFTIFIFGSVAKGEADIRSDVDFLIVFDTQQNPNQLNERNKVSEIALDLERKFNKNIQLVFSNKNFDGLDGQFVEEVMKEGIILFGRTPMVPDKKLGFMPYTLIHYGLTNLSKPDKMKVKRALYGYKTKKRHNEKIYTSEVKGLVDKLDGKRTGIASILLPHRKSRPVLDTLKEFGAKVNQITVWLPEVKFESQFDLQRFASDLDIFMSIHEESTKEKLLERIRHQTTELPYDGMPENLRDAVIKLLSILQTEIEDKNMRKWCLDILSIVSGRRDDIVNAKMKGLFLSKIEKMYDELSIEEKKYALNVLQRLQRYDPQVINELIINAIEKWTTDEFQNLLNSIKFDELNEEDRMQHKKLLWNWRAEAKKKKEEEKVNRIDKILELYTFR